MSANPSAPQPAPISDSSSIASRLRKLVIVLVAVALSAAVFFGLRSGGEVATLGAMAEAATPLEVALSDGKPSLIEFYADWCTSCQAMAPDMAALKQNYGDRVNFVMLNVDNTKWLPEMLHYRVDGIPHFEFLDAQGEAVSYTLGEQPRSIMSANLDALLAGEPLPHVRSRGRVSEVEAPVAPQSSPGADPRSHGSQVVPGA